MEVNTLSSDRNVVIIGGGIFGLSAAIVLGENGFSVTVLEKEFDIMTKASLVNQNRIHMGYHYPRSLQTGRESLRGLDNFKKYFSESINESFKKYYAISKNNSKVSAQEFYDFCMELNLPLIEKYPDKSLLDRSKVDGCWLTPEPVFDYGIIKNIICKKIMRLSNVTVLKNAKVKNIKINNDIKSIILENNKVFFADYLINATYSNIPAISNLISDVKIVGKYELCIMPILKTNIPLKNQFGITIMDGSFCSIMPKGFNQNELILYHVDKSVLQTYEGPKRGAWNSILGFPEVELIEKCSEYFPSINNMTLIDTWVATRIVLPNKEKDDARPTLLLDHKNKIYSIFSGKLTTAIDAAHNILEKLTQ